MSTHAPELELRLSVPKRIQQDRPFSVAFTVANVGSSGVYFKRPWKWASNGMYLQARGEDGLRIESETRLYDIATEDICTYFKPIAPGEEFTFHIEFGAADFGPTIRLSKPGRYHLKWIYDARHYEDEASCADANLATTARVHGRFDSRGMRAAELRDGADVALFGIGGVDMSSVAFVENNNSLKAGHAAHRECSMPRRQL